MARSALRVLLSLVWMAQAAGAEAPALPEQEVGSRSSTSGQPCRIRHADGREQPSAEFPRARLSELRAQVER